MHLCSQADNTQTVCIPTRNVAQAEKNTQPEMLPALAYINSPLSPRLAMD